MCGIAGIVKFGAIGQPPPPLDPAALEAMSDAIAHRGPDARRSWTDLRPNRITALLHRRLAIIDRPGGVQPMPNEDGTIQVIFNGEIYNHAELRKELTQKGHRFASDHSDTEVLVHGWEEWGPELPSKLLGMFAFAINDSPHETLFLARDRMGQKPLFYAPLDDGLVFASNIPSILAWPEIPRRVPREQIALYLLLGYIPAPQTIYRDISTLLPGHWIRLRKDVLDGASYWTPTTTNHDPRTTNHDLRASLSRAVESQLIADVPLACFLSGGIDSSIIAALMQQAILKKGGDPIRTISVGFAGGEAGGAESAFDESHYAATVAKKIGSHHTRLEVNARQDVLETLQRLMQTSLGQPFADSSILPTYQLSRAARTIAPVALSGDGADELFAGYDRYRALTLLGRWGGLARLMPRSLGGGGGRERYRRLAAAARESDLPDRYTRLLEIFPAELITELLGDSPNYLPLEPDPALSPMRYAMRRDQREYLPGDVLWKVDSASMLDALEVRSPFLDHHIVELANSLDDTQLVRNGRGKSILRETFAPELPPIIQSRSKKGFAVPIGEWFRTHLRQSLTDLLFSQNSFTCTHLKKPVAERLVTEHQSGARDHTHRLFALLMLELWNTSLKPTLE